MAASLSREAREGWGMANRAMSAVVHPRSTEEIVEAFRTARERGLKVAFWGNGRSYGDAALNEGNLLVDFRGMNRVLAFDPTTGELTAEPGITLDELERYALPRGFWPPVVSGTRYTTLGGCVAANVHGKNNYKYGPWGDHVVRFTFVTPDGAVRVVDRASDPELFHHAIGGFGLLGAFASITVTMKRVYGGDVRVTPVAADDIHEMFTLFRRYVAADFDYVVGWIDAFPGGTSLGRGQIHAARYLEPGEHPDPEGSLLPWAQSLPDRLFGVIPMGLLWRLGQPFSNRLGMRLINFGRFWWMKLMGAGEPHLESHTRFNHLLDFVPNWKWFYKPKSLIQFQLFLPERTAEDAVARVLELCRVERLESFLIVMKRHRPDDFPLSHAVDGYSFAMDFPVSERNREPLFRLTRRLERLVVEAGGRFYFAKDAVISPEGWRRSLGDEVVGRFFALKRRVDPDLLIQGNLWRRVMAPLWAEVPLLEDASVAQAVEQVVEAPKKKVRARKTP